MIDMKSGDTQIKVHPSKVGEMLRKGWQLTDAVVEPVAEPTEVFENDDSEEE